MSEQVPRLCTEIFRRYNYALGHHVMPLVYYGPNLLIPVNLKNNFLWFLRDVNNNAIRMSRAYNEFLVSKFLCVAV